MSERYESFADRYRRKKLEEEKAARLEELKAILAEPAKDAAELLASLHEPAARIAYAANAIGPVYRRKRDRAVYCRGVGAAAKLLGCSYQTARFVLWMDDPRHPRYAEMHARVPLGCPPLQIGTVYTVESPEHRGVVKIGFTTDLDRRLRELRREYRTPLEVHDAKVGTYVDEHALHRLLIEREVHREWFALLEPDACPDFLRAARGDTLKEGVEKYYQMFRAMDAREATAQ